MLYFPEYYKEFRCIADKCTDTCCKGWEIDIDGATLEKYRSVNGSFGERLKNSIAENEGISFFRLTEYERCPFLNTSRLCDIYLTLGENALCGICTDHPRFRSFFSDRTEIGVGLCCEAAAELILEESSYISYGENLPDEPIERAIIEIRDRLFDLCCGEPFVAVRKCCALAIEMQDMLADGNYDIKQSYSDYNFVVDKMQNDEVIALLRKMESVSDEWNEMVQRLEENKFRTDLSADDELCNIAEYFLYRHLTEALSDGDIVSKVYFALFGISAIKLFWGVYFYENGKLTKTDKINGAKLFSKGVEYSEMNMRRCYNLL